MTPEGVVKKQIRDWLKSIGAYCFSPVQMGIGSRTLDLLCCVQGRFVGIEVKRPGVNEPTKIQALTIKEIAKAGGLAFTTNSLERTKEYIQQHALHQYNPETGE